MGFSPLELIFIRRRVVLFVVCISALGLGLDRCDQALELVLNKQIKTYVTADGKVAYEEIHGSTSAVFSFQGERDHMEDRFVIEENMEKTGISLFAILDGHGGSFIVDLAKDKLIKNLCKKIVDASNIVRGISSASIQQQTNSEELEDKDKHPADPKEIDKQKPPTYDAAHYVNEAKEIDFGEMITDEVLAFDYEAMQIAAEEERINKYKQISRRNPSKSGSTALIAILYGKQLTVANVGDSRGIMCDSKGKAIPLSVDHKPNDPKEKARLEQVKANVQKNKIHLTPKKYLAMSRCLGDYEYKELNLVIAKPDILTSDLNDYDPLFLILATDGMWDVFSNEKAVGYVKKYLKKSNLGAGNLIKESYRLGSNDNITAMVVAFKDRK